MSILLFFFNDTATTEIYTLSLHDALPISYETGRGRVVVRGRAHIEPLRHGKEAIIVTEMPYQVAKGDGDRKSTRLNSSHANISYAVFCLKKQKHLTCVHSLSTPAGRLVVG